jgi:hypothetical protein
MSSLFSLIFNIEDFTYLSSDCLDEAKAYNDFSRNFDTKLVNGLSSIIKNSKISSSLRFQAARFLSNLPHKNAYDMCKVSVLSLILDSSIDWKQRFRFFASKHPVLRLDNKLAHELYPVWYTHWKDIGTKEVEDSLLDCARYLINYYPLNSAERQMGLDYVLDLLEKHVDNDSNDFLESYGILLNGDYDELFFAKRTLKKLNISEDRVINQLKLKLKDIDQLLSYDPSDQVRLEILARLDDRLKRLLRQDRETVMKAMISTSDKFAVEEFVSINEHTSEISPFFNTRLQPEVFLSIVRQTLLEYVGLKHSEPLVSEQTAQEHTILFPEEEPSDDEDCE